MANDNLPPVGSLNNKRGAGSNIATVDKTKRQPKPASAHGMSTEKKSLARKFKDTFVKEDLKDVGRDLWTQKIFPDIISMIRDAIWDGISMHFGLGGSRSSSSSSRSGYTSYGSVSSSGTTYSYGGSSNRNEITVTNKRRPAPKDWRTICFPTEAEAVKVLGDMIKNARDYCGYTELAEYIEFADFTSNDFTDHNWGWTTEMLEPVKVDKRYEAGEWRHYILLPDPISVKSK